MTPAELGPVDVLVIGAGNAAANAALSAHEAGASVAMIETAPKDARGGNSALTGGAFRFQSYWAMAAPAIEHADFRAQCPETAAKRGVTPAFPSNSGAHHVSDFQELAQRIDSCDLRHGLVCCISTWHRDRAR